MSDDHGTATALVVRAGRGAIRAGLGIAIVLVLATSTADASTTCQATPQGELCISQVDFMSFAESAFMSQLQSEWCWAASISMVLSYYQHPVSQARIVADVYGAPENIPAFSGFTIARELNRCWMDDLGVPFQSTVTAAYDTQAGINAITNQQIIAELDRGHPLVIGARTHAMVLTAIEYYQTPLGPNIVAAGVFDPWPGIGARGLEQDEMVPTELGGSMRFLASVNVMDRASPCNIGGPGPGSGTGSGGTHSDGYPGGCASSETPGSSMMVALAVAMLALRRRSRASA